MIDTTNLTTLITAFRNETEQDSISPETLGSLLQQIADIIKGATSDEDVLLLTNWFNNAKTLGSSIAAIEQGTADRNNILMNITRSDSITGTKTIQTDQLFIKQATTERAGAMRAQQVTDLNEARNNVKKILTQLETVASQISSLTDEISRLDDTDVELCELIDDLYADLDTLQRYTPYLPLYKTDIVISTTSITSPITDYFSFSMADGYYNIKRGGINIGRAIVSTLGDYKVVDIIGLCYISSTTFVYHSRLDHSLMMIDSSGTIKVTGSIETIALQNSINTLTSGKQDKLTAGAGISITGNIISVNTIPETTYSLNFSASDGVITGSFTETAYNDLRQAIIDGKSITVQSDDTYTHAICTALADDYLVVRYSVPRIQEDNATVVLSVYELKITASEYISKAIHKVLGAA